MRTFGSRQTHFSALVAFLWSSLATFTPVVAQHRAAAPLAVITYERDHSTARLDQSSHRTQPHPSCKHGQDFRHSGVYLYRPQHGVELLLGGAVSCHGSGRLNDNWINKGLMPVALRFEAYPNSTIAHSPDGRWLAVAGLVVHKMQHSHFYKVLNDHYRILLIDLHAASDPAWQWLDTVYNVFDSYDRAQGGIGKPKVIEVGEAPLNTEALFYAVNPQLPDFVLPTSPKLRPLYETFEWGVGARLKMRFSDDSRRLYFRVYRDDFETTYRNVLFGLVEQRGARFKLPSRRSDLGVGRSFMIDLPSDEDVYTPTLKRALMPEAFYLTTSEGEGGKRRMEGVSIASDYHYKATVFLKEEGSVAATRGLTKSEWQQWIVIENENDACGPVGWDWSEHSDPFALPDKWVGNLRFRKTIFGCALALYRSFSTVSYVPWARWSGGDLLFKTSPHQMGVIEGSLIEAEAKRFQKTMAAGVHNHDGPLVPLGQLTDKLPVVHSTADEGLTIYGRPATIFNTHDVLRSLNIAGPTPQEVVYRDGLLVGVDPVFSLSPNHTRTFFGPGVVADWGREGLSTLDLFQGNGFIYDFKRARAHHLFLPAGLQPPSKVRAAMTRFRNTLNERQLTRMRAPLMGRDGKWIYAHVFFGTQSFASHAQTIQLEHQHPFCRKHGHLMALARFPLGSEVSESSMQLLTSKGWVRISHYTYRPHSERTRSTPTACGWQWAASEKAQAVSGAVPLSKIIAFTAMDEVTE